MVKHDGNCTEHNMIRYFKKYFNSLFVPFEPYHLIEGKYADSYTDPKTMELIAIRYKERWIPDPNPLSHPESYDPLDPPKGWRYDPFYETWIKVNE